MNTMAETKPVPSAASPTPASLPLLSRPEFQRVFYPSLVAVLLIGLWQWWVTAFDIPKFLVPSPLLVAQTLVTDAALLFGALLGASVAATGPRVAAVAIEMASTLDRFWKS